MGGGHAEVLFQPVGALNARQILGQAVEQGVVDRSFGLRHSEGNEAGHEHRQDRHRVAHYKTGRALQPWNKGAVGMAGDGAPEGKQQRRQNGDGADHPQQNALGHDQADVPPQGKAHGAHGQKARDGGEGTGQNRGEGFLYSLHHGPLRVRTGQLLFLKPVQQEDGKVHRNPQLQHGGQSLGDVADLAQEDVGAEVIPDGEDHAQHEDQRHHRFLHAQEQHHQTGAHRAEDVQRHLLIDQRPGILQNGGDTADETALVQQLFDGILGRHGHRMGAGVIKLYHQQGGPAVAVEKAADIRRQHLFGGGHIQQVVRPQHGAHPFHLRQRLLEGQRIGLGHVLHRDHGGGRHVEILVQHPLPYHGVQLRRQIGEDVVVDIGAHGAEDRGDQQQNRRQKHRFSMPHHPACEPFHRTTLPFPVSGKPETDCWSSSSSIPQK